MAAELADEAAIGLERPRHPGDHELGPAHPVKRRIGEDRVELGLEGKRVAVDALHLETFGGGSGQTLLAQITPKDVGAGSGDLLGQCAIAAAKVENPLAALRRQQIENVVGQLRNEASVAGIILGRPALHHLWRDDLGGAHSVCPGFQGS